MSKGWYQNHMKEKEDCRELVAELLTHTVLCLSKDQAEDLVDETCTVVTDVLNRFRCDYPNAESVVEDYLQLGPAFTWIFRPD